MYGAHIQQRRSGRSDKRFAASRTTCGPHSDISKLDVVASTNDRHSPINANHGPSSGIAGNPGRTDVDEISRPHCYFEWHTDPLTRRAMRRAIGSCHRSSKPKGGLEARLPVFSTAAEVTGAGGGRSGRTARPATGPWSKGSGGSAGRAGSPLLHSSRPASGSKHRSAGC